MEGPLATRRHLGQRIRQLEAAALSRLARGRLANSRNRVIDA